MPKISLTKYLKIQMQILIELIFIEFKNNLGRVLDLFFVSTNDNGILSRAGHPLLSNSMHHVALQFETAMYEFVKDRKYSFRRNVYRANYNCLNSHFSNIDWLNALSACDLSDAYNALKKVIDSSIRKYVPLEKQCNNYKVP